MELIHSLTASLASPMVLAFALGVFATLIRSDLKIPDAIHSGLTIYLLFAIGLKGGTKLEGVDFGEIWKPLLSAVVLCIAIPILSFLILKKLGRFDAVNAGAIAAHYGSVSAVTFTAAIAFLDARHIPHEGFLPALLAVMEVPAIIVSLWLVHKSSRTHQMDRVTQVFRELFAGKGIVLLLGGMFIGLASGKKGYADLAPLFDAPFRGVLTLFLLEIGLLTGQRLHDLKAAGPFLAGFALIMPLVNGLIGVQLAQWSGLSIGGAAVFGTLAASASYIAAPAAVRVALPQANPAFYLTSALAITFPFNIVIGIPIYFAWAQKLYAC